MKTQFPPTLSFLAGDVLPGPPDLPEILVRGSAQDARFMELAVGRIILHARLDPMWAARSLLTVGVPDAPTPLEFIVDSMDDVVFHLHEVATEAAAGRWS